MKIKQGQEIEIVLSVDEAMAFLRAAEKSGDFVMAFRLGGLLAPFKVNYANHDTEDGCMGCDGCCEEGGELRETDEERVWRPEDLGEVDFRVDGCVEEIEALEERVKMLEDIVRRMGSVVKILQNSHHLNPRFKDSKI